MVYLHFKVYYHAKYPAVTYDSSKRKHLEGFFKIAFGNHRMLLERESERGDKGQDYYEMQRLVYVIIFLKYRC